MDRYKYRGYPCSIQSEDKLWCVVGEDIISNSAGVLEWCYDQKDAEQVKAIMAATNNFRQLEAIPYSKF